METKISGTRESADHATRLPSIEQGCFYIGRALRSYGWTLRPWTSKCQSHRMGPLLDDQQRHDPDFPFEATGTPADHPKGLLSQRYTRVSKCRIYRYKLRMGLCCIRQNTHVVCVSKQSYDLEHG